MQAGGWRANTDARTHARGAVVCRRGLRSLLGTAGGARIQDLPNTCWVNTALLALRKPSLIMPCSESRTHFMVKI